MDCEEGTLISVNGGYWMEKYIGLYIFDGLETIAEGCSPIYLFLSSDNYVINMFDSSMGNGWNGNINDQIGDEDNFYTIEDSVSINVISVGECILIGMIH